MTFSHLSSKMFLLIGKISAFLTAAFVYESTAAPATPLGDVNDAALNQVSDLSLGENPSFDMRIIPLENRPVRPTSILLTALDALTIVGIRDYTAQSPLQQLRFQMAALSEVII